HDMPWPVELHGDVGQHPRREYLTVDAVEARPEIARPADQMLGVVPADERVVGDVETARARVVREDPCADVLEPAVLHRQALRPGDELRAGENRDLRVSKRQAFEV